MRHFLLGCFLLTASVAAFAAPSKFDIPAQPAPAALQAFMKQSGTQVAYPADDLKVVSTNAVSGEYEPMAALGLLLKDTGFSARETKSGWFAVARIVAEKPGSIEGVVRAADTGRGVAGARVEIAGTDKFVLTDKRGRFTFDEAPTGDQELHITAEGMQNTKVTDVTVKPGHRHTLSSINIPAKAPGVVQLDTFVVSAKKNDGVIELDPYSVEGRKEKPFVSGNMDIPRTINDAQPYYIFDAKAIDRSGAVNVEDFLKQRLTMNTVATTNGQVSGLTNAGNTSSINLRGVGRDQTLVLVNGRRVAGVNISSIDNQPDLNGIPFSAIDRIEVLPASASGIYGGSAIGGVVNVILKRDYAGGEIRLNFGNTFESDSFHRSVSASYGLSLEGGRTHFSVSGAWSDQKPLLLQDRAGIFRENLVAIQGRAPNFFYTNTNPWLGSLPNIGFSRPLVLKNGNVPLNSPITYVPAGTSASTSATVLAAGLLANDGQWNFDLPLSTQAPTGLLRPFGSTPESRSFQAGLRRQMMPSLELFADFSWNENKTNSVFHPFTTNLVVPAAAPTNPFTTTVVVKVPDADHVSMNTSSQNQSATFGVVAQLPWDWTGTLDYTWSQNRFDYLYYLRDTAAVSADLLSGALNPFVDTLLYPLNFKKYLQPVSYNGGVNQLHSVALRGSGSLPRLPWGQPELTVGLERRIARTPESNVRFDYPVSLASSFATKYYARETTTDSGYLETTVPLVKEDWLQGLHSLNIQLSGRRESYEVDTGTLSETTLYNLTPPATSYAAPTLNGQPFFSKAKYASSNYTVGLKYQPVKELTLRVSRATAFLPPAPTQLIRDPVQSTFTTLVNDPVTGQNNVPVFTLTGGNPNLTPQNSKSLNAGIIWEPSWKPLKGLRLNAEYYKIEQFDAISTLGAQGIVTQESLYPGRVTRDSTGRITLVDNSMVNLFHRETEGWDLSLDYALQTSIGRFSLNVVESIVLHLKTQYSRTQPEYDAAGFSPAEQGTVKYKTNATLNWDLARWTAGWTTRRFSSYKQYGAAGGPYSTQFASGADYLFYITPQGSNTIPSQTYHDLYIGYRFGARNLSGPGPTYKALGDKLFDGITVQIGVRNVFDKVPPLDVYHDFNYYFSPYGDVRLRSYWLSVRKSF